MYSFKEYLQESFDKVLPYRESEIDGIYDPSWIVNGKNIDYGVVIQDGDRDTENDLIYYLASNFYLYDVSFSPLQPKIKDGSIYELTQEFESSSVFRTVFSILLDHYQTIHNMNDGNVLYYFYPPSPSSRLKSFYSKNFERLNRFLPMFNGMQINDIFILIPKKSFDTFENVASKLGDHSIKRIF